MSRISIAFFGSAALYALAGMALGMFMGASGDHSLAPVHAHINLLGWATLALMGSFYGLAGSRTPNSTGLDQFRRLRPRQPGHPAPADAVAAGERRR